jgi:hypothetical protein
MGEEIANAAEKWLEYAGIKDYRKWWPKRALKKYRVQMKCTGKSS